MKQKWLICCAVIIGGIVLGLGVFKPFEPKDISGVPSPVLGNVQLDSAIKNFLLSKNEFSWKVASGTTNFCVFQNLDPQGDGLFPIYVWARCGEFGVENGKIKEFSGSFTPVKIDYPNELSYYDISKFKAEYALTESDIKKVLPERIWSVMRLDSAELNNQILKEAQSLLNN